MQQIAAGTSAISLLKVATWRAPTRLPCSHPCEPSHRTSPASGFTMINCMHVMHWLVRGIACQEMLVDHVYVPLNAWLGCCLIVCAACLSLYYSYLKILMISLYMHNAVKELISEDFLLRTGPWSVSAPNGHYQAQVWITQTSIRQAIAIIAKKIIIICSLL